MKNTKPGTLLLLLAGLASAQTATFTFGSLPNPFLYNASRCASMTSWNGIAATDPNNPFPLNMGDICLAPFQATAGSTQSVTDIEVPWQLGFPNNGYLQQCAPTVWQALIDNGDGTASQAFTASGCYDGQNTIISATANYRKVYQTTCSGRQGCHTFTKWQVVSGSGTVSNQPTAAILREQRIQADLDNDPCEPIILFPWAVPKPVITADITTR